MISAVFKAVATSARGSGGFDSHALPPLTGQRFTRTCTIEQNHNTALQSCAYPESTPEVKPEALSQSCAFSEHDPDKTGKLKCAISVQPELPADLARLAELWGKLPPAVKSGWLVTAEALATGNGQDRA